MIIGEQGELNYLQISPEEKKNNQYSQDGSKQSGSPGVGIWLMLVGTGMGADRSDKAAVPASQNRTGWLN